jgi:hypothetical protein
MQELLEMNVPTSQLEVKIVLPIALNICSRSVYIFLRARLKGCQDGTQAAYHKISPNMFDPHQSLL